MNILKFNLEEKSGVFKLLNATNGGPIYKRHATDQKRSNFEDYKAARIPYSRNHDSAVHGVYGGPYSHDISCIFPDFDADPESPASYDFACTDEAILACLEAGTKTFFRLGQTIEHQIKKHATLPPKDLKKWAVICEHIISHYTEGWNDGLYLDMLYWEIWNEPDLDSDDSENKRTWGGTKEQFFDFYEISAKHLKKKFPNLKIGGPALAWNDNYADEFLEEMKKRGVEIDFFSWHLYSTSPKEFERKANHIKSLLIKHGYENTESILNEWNYVKGWEDEFVYTIKSIHGIKGAAFIMACMSVAQSSPIDMLMYYDTRPSVFNGVFDFYTCEPLKGYYAFNWYGKLYDAEYEICAENKIDDIYSLCGVDENNKITAIITYYTDDDEAAVKNVHVDFGKTGKYNVYCVDEKHNGEWIESSENLVLNMKPNSFFLICE